MLKSPGFTFDRVFDSSTKQNDIFDWGVKGIVEGTLSAFIFDRYRWLFSY